MNMNVKIVITSVAIALVLLLFIYYRLSTVFKTYNIQGSAFKNYSFVKALNKSSSCSGHYREDYLIDTPVCYIPNYAKDTYYGESYSSPKPCGQRAVFIEDQRKRKPFFRIDVATLKKYSKAKEIKCCYRFLNISSFDGREDTYMNYTSCIPFKNKSAITLKQEVITVRCVEIKLKEKIHSIVYEDAYITLKGLPKKKKKNARKRWNVIIVGMGSMSRGRLISLMPNTAQNMQDHKWLEFLGYNKVAWNTYDNFMSLLTGRKLSTIKNKCGLNDNGCNDLMIWSKFKDAGYVTAYGEDHLTLRDTLAKNRFKAPPTDHYMRPFFSTGEKRRNNIICTNNRPSVNHLLNYAYEFANYYKDVPFFGSFWINSYTTENMSSIIDEEVHNFFNKMGTNSILSKNTFIFLVGARGNEQSDLKMPIKTYYEDRLPVLFVKTPAEFRSLYRTKYHNMELNQARFITPYDVYVTFASILNINKSNIEVKSEACPESTSLFEQKSLHRTCTDACIAPEWCSCRSLTKLEQKGDVNNTITALISYIQNRTSATRTLPCTTCQLLTLKSILRIHTFKDDFNQNGYVIAIEMNPGELVYEANIINGENLPEFRQNENLMTGQYNRKGFCVINDEDRPFCVCKLLCTGIR